MTADGTGIRGIASLGTGGRSDDGFVIVGANAASHNDGGCGVSDIRPIQTDLEGLQQTGIGVTDGAITGKSTEMLATELVSLACVVDLVVDIAGNVVSVGDGNDKIMAVCVVFTIQHEEGLRSHRREPIGIPLPDFDGPGIPIAVAVGGHVMDHDLLQDVVTNVNALAEVGALAIVERHRRSLHVLT